MNSEPVLETHDLAKRYGRRTWALTGIDLAIPQGESRHWWGRTPPASRR